MSGRVFLVWTSTKQGLIYLAQGQCIDASEARIRNPSVLSQALYHWTIALPKQEMCCGGYHFQQFFSFFTCQFSYHTAPKQATWHLTIIYVIQNSASKQQPRPQYTYRAATLNPIHNTQIRLYPKITNLAINPYQADYFYILHSSLLTCSNPFTSRVENCGFCIFWFRRSRIKIARQPVVTT